MNTELWTVPLDAVTRKRYLNYALSVITSRALPDVRDGLKPVHRRILYAMYNDLGLRHDARYRKSAAVVGDVMGKYHPHGDTAIYDALVRMAQSFSLRTPLVDGHGNFGSVDGDRAAAMRYTECRLQAVAEEMLVELRSDTVDFRDNYDGTRKEPIVLPARFPQLLVNGSTGIAVGMATNIPPHNLREVVDASMLLIDNPEATNKELCRKVRAPDFPTGGRILNSKAELLEIYETGHGAVRLQGEYSVEELPRNAQQLVVSSIPYNVDRGQLVEKIAELILGRKVPQLLDVRDESTTDTRIVLELKRGANPDAAMAFLYKHTPLQTNFHVNMTCLVPTDRADVGAPRRLGLREVLGHFLEFRYEVVKRRFEYELRKLLERIHILEGFETIFDALDEAIRIIRRSDGKADAAKKLMKRFDLDAIQTDAILELRLYKLAKLEILKIREELAEKRKRARAIQKILASKKLLWGVVKSELQELREAYGDKRRTRLGGEELEFDPSKYIVNEDFNVIVTRDGWVKRQKEVRDIKTVRIREGDEVMTVAPGAARATIAFFTNYGSAYVCRINDIPATTGYGDPVQAMFKFKDGERVVWAESLDPRMSPGIDEELPEDAEPTPPYMFAMSRGGFGLRFSLHPHKEPSTRSGRRFARPPKGDEIIGVGPCDGHETVIAVSEKSHVLLCHVDEVNVLAGAGKGVTVIKIGKDDKVLDFMLADSGRDGMWVTNSRGTRTQVTALRKVTARGGKGAQLFKRERIVEVEKPPVEVLQLEAQED